MKHYTIPRNNRELQRNTPAFDSSFDYTIPRNNRELQLLDFVHRKWFNYTIPRNNRELQHDVNYHKMKVIIPYQEIIGNYSAKPEDVKLIRIIPYQEIIGNYS